MPLLPHRHLLFSLLLGLSCSATPASEEGLPSWVTGEREALVIQRSSIPSYLQITQTATILRPKALTKAEELEQLNPGLGKVLPGLPELIKSASVSPKFKTLYDAKIKSVKGGDFMPADTFFDCATVLDLKDPKTGRRAVLFQTDMETDTDGTDPVRLPSLKDYDDARLSRTFQPLLAYSWNMEHSAKNPFLKYYSDTLTRLRALKKEVDGYAETDQGPVWQDLKKQFADKVTALDKKAKYYHDDLTSRRSLVASLDPFIVIPQNWVDQQMAPGNFAAVIHAGHVYPCIVGDTGPDTKAGEASQKLARALNPKASGLVSAATTPSVTYIVFPGTKPVAGAPNLNAYRAEVSRLLGEIGGLGVGEKLHSWE